MNEVKNSLRAVRGKTSENRFTAQFALVARTTALLLAILIPAVGHAATNTIFFTYTNRNALLADGWSFIVTTNAVVQNMGSAIFNGGAQNTEITDTNIGAAVSYHKTNSSLGVVTRIPCDVGYMWGSPITFTNGTVPRLNPDPLANQTRNSLFRSLPTNWVSMRLALSFAPTGNYHDVRFQLYQDDDNYVEEQYTYNSFLASSPFNLPGPTAVGLEQEFYTFPSRVSQTYVTATNLTLRLDRDTGSGSISAFWS